MKGLSPGTGFSLRIACLIAISSAVALFPALPAYAGFGDCAISWDSFANDPGYIADYTYQGQVIKDTESNETGGDDSHGTANVPPSQTDLASAADAGGNPGGEATPSFGYYNGDTEYDPDDPATMEDDYIFFRMRIRGDPADKKDGFNSYHWNILFDVDGDGYKEYWIDLEGSYTSSGNPATDRLNILYDNDNRQDIPDPDVARVEYFSANSTDISDAGCTALDPTSPGLSHTRVVAASDGSGDYWIEIQAPMTAFNDGQGNQVLYPDSPVAFIFSTGASNQNPLQKDFMMDIDFLSLQDPITFGDPVYPNGQPTIDFSDDSYGFVSYYLLGDQIYVYVTDGLANDDELTAETITVVVTNPANNDEETITLQETNLSSGIFTNIVGGGLLNTVSDSGVDDDGDNNGDLEVTSGDIIQVSYTNENLKTVTDSATIIDACETFMEFTRANGLASSNFTITLDTGTSDKLYVTAFHPEASGTGITNTISVTLTGPSGDEETITLTETGTDTAVFRNTAGLDTLISDGIDGDDQQDGVWEDSDLGEVTATYSYTCGGSSYAATSTAELFVTGTAGRVYFTSGPGTADIDLYSANEAVFIKVEDVDACTTAIGGVETLTVDLFVDDPLSPDDTRLNLTLYETFPGSAVFMNRKNDLVTTLGSAIVSSASSAFVTNGVSATNDFAIATGPDIGLYEISSVDGEQDLTLDSSLTASRTDIGFTEFPLIVNTTGGSPSTSDYFLEAEHNDTLTVQYDDCSDGDNDSSNDIKTDTASYNAPTILINEVMFYPDTANSCQTEYVELFNSTSSSIPISGYVLTDEDDFSYTVPTYGGSGLNLGPGESLIISIVNSPRTNFDLDGTYYFFATSSNFPDDLGDPSTGTADQLTLYDGLSNAVDYVGWSNTVSPDIDFLGDDASAVSVSIWQDDAFVDVTSIAISNVITRSPPGVDSNVPGDWAIAGTEICEIIIATPVIIASFGTYVEDGRVMVQWETASEVQTVGFDLLRLDGGRYRRVNERLLPGLLTAGQGGKYSLADLGAEPGVGLSYMLVEVEYDGTRRSYGPFSFNADGTAARAGTVPGALPRGEQSRVFMYRMPDGTIVVSDSTGGTLGTLNLASTEVQRHVIAGNTLVLTASLLEGPSAHSGSGSITGSIDGDGTIVLNGEKKKKQKDDGGTIVDAGLFNLNGYSEDDVADPEVLEDSSVADYTMAPREMTEQKQARIEASAESFAEADEKRAARSGPAIKITVTEDGIYFLPASKVAELVGIGEGKAAQMISKAQLSLSSGGGPVAYHPAEGGSGLYFYGQKTRTKYTDRNVYWLQPGPGLTMGVAPTGVTGPGATSFNDTLSFEADLLQATGLFKDPSEDYWLWKFAIAGYAGLNEMEFTFQAPDPDGLYGEAFIAIHLRSSTGATHLARLTLNGVDIGEVGWDGLRGHSATVKFPQALLADGANSLSVTALPVVSSGLSVIFTDSFEVTYRRLYGAVSDRLLLRADGNEAAAMSGFNSPGVMAFAISEPHTPTVYPVLEESADEGGVSAVLPFTAGDVPYMAITAAGALAPAGVWADEPSTLRLSSNEAEFVLIAPLAFAAEAETLASYRRAQGLKSMVVVLEDIMDEFNHGVSSPLAIRDFIAHARANWLVPPRYIVLAGEGSIDYKDAEGYGENIVPTMVVGTENGIFPSDTFMADTDGDYVPEVAIGRLPVLTPVELAALIDKIIAYEAALPSTPKNIILLADDPEEDADFTADSRALAALVPGGFGISEVYLGQMSTGAARESLFDEIRAGALLLNYVGHAGLDRYAQEGLIVAPDVEALLNAPMFPVVMAMTCMGGQFAFPGFDSIGEALILDPTGGASAVISPTGMSDNNQAKHLNRAFFEAAFSGDFDRLGDVLVKAMADFPLTDRNSYMLRIYNLLGDPALRIWQAP